MRNDFFNLKNFFALTYVTKIKNFTIISIPTPWVGSS